MRQLFIASLLALSSAMAFAAPAPSVLDIKHSLRDDNVRPPESFETQSRELEENFFLRNYTDARPNSKEAKTGTAEEYTQKLAQLNSGIEMPYNPVVGKLIDMYLVKRRGLVSNMLALHDYYGDIFIEELEKEGLPLELQYLPVIESAINPNAVSRMGATGLWQFMPATAKGLGMEVSSLVDERRDARESSRNAARYLKQLYNIYGDWSLAIAAYNCGPGNVNKARRRAGEASSDFWEIYNYLPKETRGYVPAFIAANFVMNYHDDYGIHRPLIKRPLITDTVEVRERVHFNQIANVLNIPVDEIRMLNPQYRKDVIPGSPSRPYALTLPSQQVLSYISSRDDILAYESDKYSPRTTVNVGKRKEKEPEKQDEEKAEEQTATEQAATDKQPVIADAVTRTTHTVGRGEDLGSIAKSYGVSATDIKHWNNLRRGKVREGQQLVIELRQRNSVAAVNTRTPSKNVASDVPARQTKSVTATQPGYRDVPERTRTKTAAPARTVPQRNSEKYKNSRKERQAQAKAAESKKQKKQTARQKPAKPVVHDVKKGESLEKIAKRHGVSVEALQKANGMKKNSTNLQIGQELKIPKKTADKNSKNAKASKNDKKSKGSKDAKSASKNSKSSKDTKKSQKQKSTSSKKRKR